MAARRLHARQSAASQTASDSSTSWRQPTTTIGLSTTFTPAASCASNKLTMLPPPGFFIWANEPVPFTSTTVTNCYPEEFLRSYTSLLSGTLVSSIVPVMSPLVCPSNFCTQYVAEDNYIACCPSGYLFEPPATPKVRERPGYGGTCYSQFTVASTATVLQYDSIGETNMAPFVASTSGANAYAHPIDGFAPFAPRLGCAATSSSLASLGSAGSSGVPSGLASSIGSSLPSASASPSGSSSTPPGTIAGAVVGSLAGLIAIVGLVFFLLRRRKSQRSESAQQIHQVEDDLAEPHPMKAVGHSATELSTSDKYGHRGLGPNEVYEMNTETVHEMPGWTDAPKEKP
ncbi:hypothetical protein FB567DRAFT_1151 [Paraphoma chrysanthemicola]|uniref:Uncharacterized protein n=1 Tax=Paraphoma chrysanthemicola TaxID=798071 RepID=A0A8K0RG34_9PLEO|nr:hypothetical protein FB567DRAFT_1151 [Paraphoma chrysanthemicola]